MIIRMLERQWLHFVALAVLVGAVGAIARHEAFRTGDLLGLGSLTWLWLAVGASVAHQVYVWLCWRAELHGALLSRVLGRAAFGTYAAGFVVLGLSRVATAWAVAAANPGTLPVDPSLARTVAFVLVLPAAYLFYSVRRYFGFRRALGIDHFDASYRTMPLVREGIFRWSQNGMYVFGFLLFWAIAFWYASAAATAAAAFNHLYIWVHYHATEKPDMRRIYGV